MMMPRIVETSGSQVGSPAAEKKEEERGGDGGGQRVGI